MKELASEPHIVEMIKRELGTCTLYASQIHAKAPRGEGKAVPWHQDGGLKVRTVWIPLDHIDDKNGGLQVLDRAHTHGRLDFKRVSSEEDFQTARFYANYNVFEVDLHSQEGVFQYKISAGGLAMHHPLIPHSSPPNICRRRRRRVIILRYMAASEPRPAGHIFHYKTGEKITKQYLDL